MPDAPAVEEKKAPPPGLEDALRARILDLLTPSTPGGPFRLSGDDSVDLAVAGASSGGFQALLSLVEGVRPKLAIANVLSSVGRTLRPDATKLVTNVLPRMNQRGPGIALSLVGRRSKVLDSVVLWDADFSARRDPSTEEPDPSLAIAAASWIQFHMAPLRRKDVSDYKRAFGTTSWLSFAHFQVGCARQQLGDWAGAEKAYASALAVDAFNARATFNAGVVDMRRGNMDQAITRLKAVDAHVERVAKRIKAKDPECERFPPAPFWYQAQYQLAAALFHHGVTKSPGHLADATERALKLAQTTVCAILTLENKYDSASAKRLGTFLQREIEGQALVLLADAVARSASPPPDTTPESPKSRREVLDALCSADAASAGLPGRLVDFVTRRDDLPDHRVCYNLACYYSGRAGKDEKRRARHLDDSLTWLRFALESGDLCSWAIEDPSLACVREEREKEFAGLCTGFVRSGDLRGLRAVGELADALGKIGVSTAADLLAKVATSEGLSKVARGAGVPRRTVERWRGLAKLAALGIPLHVVNLLDGVDVRNVGVLARSDPDEVIGLTHAAGRAEGIGQDDLPTSDQVKAWIAKAKRETHD